jgi:uncharacterized glyoxalase superfamily protein PhnB/GNAT superfamily N-acetyltransferase
MTVTCREADIGDLDAIAGWNRQLQEDEGSPPMARGDIAARLDRWLDAGYRAVVFESAQAPVGYALFCVADPDLKGPDGIYLRQFFILRERRRQGFGRRAYAAFAREFCDGREIVLEALGSNPGAHTFWQTLGFEPYSITYHRTTGDRGPATAPRDAIAPPAPPGWHTVTTRLFVEDVAGMVHFLRNAFAAVGETADGRPTEIRIGDAILMVSDTTFRETMPACLYVYVADTDATYRRAMASGAVSLEAPLDTPYGDRRCMVRDPGNIVWQIATHRPG